MRSLIYSPKEPFHLKELMDLENRLVVAYSEGRESDGWGAWGYWMQTTAFGRD